MLRRSATLSVAILSLAALLLGTAVCVSRRRGCRYRTRRLPSYPSVGLDLIFPADRVPKQGQAGVHGTENGSGPRRPRHVGLEDRNPIDVVLLIDTSGSMKGRPLGRRKDGGQQARRSDGALGPRRFGVVQLRAPVGRGLLGESRAHSRRHPIAQPSGRDGALRRADPSPRACSGSGRDATSSCSRTAYDTVEYQLARWRLGLSRQGGTPVYAVALSSPDYNPDRTRSAREAVRWPADSCEELGATHRHIPGNRGGAAEPVHGDVFQRQAVNKGPRDPGACRER